MPKGVYPRQPRTPETRAKISASMRGRAKSPETRAKMSAAKMGHAPSNTPWKDGAAMGYSGIHYRAGLVHPMECAHADESCKGRLELALRHDVAADLIRVDPRLGRHFYVGDPAVGYMRLCRSHHVRYDLTARAS